MPEFDPYSTLGVGKNSSPDEIKKAYRKLARQYHPDHNPGDNSAADKFKDVKKAYDILSDPARKQQYDSYGFTGDEQPGAGGFGGGFQGGGFGVNFEDIFESMFGADKEISVRVLTACEECKGTGARAGTSRSQCSNCHGSGQIKVMQNTLLGRMMQVKACPHCNGTGTVVTDPCPNCRGQGRVDKTVRKKINIPAGVDTGNRLRVPGAGHAGETGAPPGDMYVMISVRNHEYFERKGQDIHLKVPIGLAQAALGVELEVPTLEGTESLVIPPGTRSGSSFRLAGRGAPRVNRSGKGDQIVTVVIDVPKRLSSQQTEALRNYAKLVGETVENVDNSLMSRLKRVFGRR